jgi:hypothetical protein
VHDARLRDAAGVVAVLAVDPRRRGTGGRAQPPGNRVERERLAADAVRSATALGIRVIEADGSVPAV